MPTPGCLGQNQTSSSFTRTSTDGKTADGEEGRVGHRYLFFPSPCSQLSVRRRLNRPRPRRRSARKPKRSRPISCREPTLEEKLGQLMNVGPAIPRLNVPAYNWWTESLHGAIGAAPTTNFPEPIGLAATFDTPLVYERSSGNRPTGGADRRACSGSSSSSAPTRSQSVPGSRAPACSSFPSTRGAAEGGARWTHGRPSARSRACG